MPCEIAAPAWRNRPGRAALAPRNVGMDGMDLGIKGRIAVVSGGDSGMGLETARILSAEGVRIALTDKTEASLRSAAATLPGEVVAISADLTKPADVERLHKMVVQSLGEASILVHAAGITGPTGDPLTLTDAEWQVAIDNDFMTAVRMCRAFVPGMRSTGWGRVVLMGSEDAAQPYSDELPYCAAKAAVLNLSKGLSKTYAKDGVLFNAVSPAFIATPMTDAMMEKRAKKDGVSFDEAIQTFLKQERPTLELQRRGKAEEVAAAIAFLCSEHASFINGANLRVDGGSVASV